MFNFNSQLRRGVDIMTLRYFEVVASGHDATDTRFDKEGMYVGYSSLVQAPNIKAAEVSLRKEKRFRRYMRPVARGLPSDRPGATGRRRGPCCTPRP